MEYRYKHIVVVHGIGDQARNETALGFVNELARALPQGEDYTVKVDNLIESVDSMLGKDTRKECPVQPPQFRFVDNKRQIEFIIGFSEVYWQDITNGYLKENDGQLPLPLFTWARSLNTRLLKDPRTYALAIGAIDNIEKLLGLGRLLAFINKQSARFNEITDKFLGDVQMYTESDILRQRINRRFIDVMDKVEKCISKPHNAGKEDLGKPEIYIVAHSEGTVVTYNSLVDAVACACKVLMDHDQEHEEFRWLNDVLLDTGDGIEATYPNVQPQQRLDKQKESADNVMRWFRQIKGLVTLGSPLDKHYTIWDNCFRRDCLKKCLKNCLKDKSLCPLKGLKEIPWFNYWDHSDPVGFGLNKLFEANKSGDGTEESSDAKKLFSRKYDSGYSRYPVPGVAHVAYWKDPGIYQNIIHEVMELVPGESETVASKLWVQELHKLDYPLYVLIRLATLGIGIFFLYKLLQPNALDSLWESVTGIVPSGLLGITGGQLIYVISVISIVPSLLALKWLPCLYRNVPGETFQNSLRNAHRLFLGVWVAWVIYLCLAVGKGTEVELKDWLGYGMGLVATVFAWMLHSRVHLGLVQMWRYTKGKGTGLKDVD